MRHFRWQKKEDGIYLSYITCIDADKGNAENEKQILKLAGGDIYLKLAVDRSAICSFSYSSDNTSFTPVDERFIAAPGKWIGAKFGFACTRKKATNDAGFADIDWVRIDK